MNRFCGLVILTAAAPLLQAQYAAPPEAYSVTQINSMMGPAMTTKVSRDGSRAVVETSGSTGGAEPFHSITAYDLQSGTTKSWNPSQPSGSCSAGAFRGDWGDPFASSAGMIKDLQGARQDGTETIEGIGAKVYEAPVADGSTAKAWIEPKYGLLMKLVLAPKSGPAKAIIETTEVHIGKPQAAVFALPASCGAVSATPPAVADKAEHDRLAAATGDDPANFANAMMPPASKDSCSVRLRVVRAGSGEPMPGVGISLDTTVDPQTFQGKGARDMTGQVRGGVLAIDNAPAQFRVGLTFGSNAGSDALIYRQCFGPQTNLLVVVNGPGKLSDWLWVKAGKFAAH